MESNDGLEPHGAATEILFLPYFVDLGFWFFVFSSSWVSHLDLGLGPSDLRRQPALGGFSVGHTYVQYVGQFRESVQTEPEMVFLQDLLV